MLIILKCHLQGALCWNEVIASVIKTDANNKHGYNENNR